MDTQGMGNISLWRIAGEGEAHGLRRRCVWLSGGFVHLLLFSFSLCFFFARRFSEMVNSLRTSLILVGLWILGKGVGFGLVGWVG
jgi:hypothetical protein